MTVTFTHALSEGPLGDHLTAGTTSNPARPARIDGPGPGRDSSADQLNMLANMPGW